jgi:hypothetical protein
MAFSSTLVKTGVMGDMSYAIFTYNSAGVTTGTITTLKGVLGVAWTPATIRASATIDYTSTPGNIVIAGVTAGDTGTVIVFYKGGF